MIIFLYGSDGYRLKESVDTIVGAYRKKYENGMSYYRFDFTSPTCKGISEVSDAVKSVSFFDEAKLIIIKNVSYYTGLTSIVGYKGLIQDFKISEDKKTVLVFTENKSESDLRKANKDLFALLSGKNNIVRNFEYLSGAKLSNWVKNKFKKNGHNVSPAIVSRLINAVGYPALASKGGVGESWALANEINKLSNYHTSRSQASGDGSPASKEITERDIDLLVGRKEVNNIFQLTDAVGNQNKAKAFEIMFRLANSGQDPHYLLSMLVYHFENLLSVYDLLSRGQDSGGGILASSGLHPFVAKKVASQARRFSKEDLLSKFNYLAELDIASKNGQINLEDALYNFTVS